jgi:hypothetical protein
MLIQGFEFPDLAFYVNVMDLFPAPYTTPIRFEDTVKALFEWLG